MIQEGTFGKVYQGRFKNDDLEDISTDEEDVMIKTVMSWSSSTQSQLLVIDGVKLAGLNHKHILRYFLNFALGFFDSWWNIFL